MTVGKKKTVKRVIRLKARPPVFQWDSGTSPITWKKDLVLKIKQMNQSLKPEKGAGDTLSAYLKVYEADKKPWKEKEAIDEKDLAPVFEISGSFDGKGIFTVSEANVLASANHCLTAEIKLLNKDGTEIPLQVKDSSGKTLKNLIVPMPDVDARDDTWELDLAMWTADAKRKKKYEKYLHRLEVKVPKVAELLNEANYVDKLGKCEEYASKSQKRSPVKSFKFLFIHCTSCVGAPSLAEWFTFNNCDTIWKSQQCGAHFAIDRKGKIYGCVEPHRVANHAGKCDRAYGGAGANKFSIGIELIGCVDDVSVSTALAKQLLLLRASTPKPGGGKLSGPVLQKLKQINALLCHGSTKKKKRVDNMLEVVKSYYVDDDFKGMTSIEWIPDNRDKWESAFGYGAVGDLMNRVVQLLYFDALASQSSGKSIELKIVKPKRMEVTPKKLNIIKKVSLRFENTGKVDYLEESLPKDLPIMGSAKIKGKNYHIIKIKGERRLVTKSKTFVEITEGVAKCTHNKGSNVDSKSGITLYRLEKNDEVNCKIVSNGTVYWALVEKDEARNYNLGLVDTLLDLKKDYSSVGFAEVEPLKVIHKAKKADVNTLVLSYTPEQYASLADLTQALHKIYQFECVVTHHCAAARQKRKRDPGGFFEWDKLTNHKYVENLKKEVKDFQNTPANDAEREEGGKWPP